MGLCRRLPLHGAALFRLSAAGFSSEKSESKAGRGARGIDVALHGFTGARVKL
jgi:hypothetical protein